MRTKATTKKDFTPNDIAKVMTEVVKKQKTQGYKPMWAKHEMTRRADAAEKKGGSFVKCFTDSTDLGWNALNVANGDATIGEYKEGWENYYEMQF